MYESFLINPKTNEVRTVGTPHEEHELKAQGWQPIPEGVYSQLLDFNKIKQLKEQNTKTIAVLKEARRELNFFDKNCLIKSRAGGGYVEIDPSLIDSLDYAIKENEDK